MSISYQPAEPSDAASFARCQLEAFKEDGYYKRAFGFRPTAEQTHETIDYLIKRYQRRFVHPYMFWIKATDETTGEIVGISGWAEPEDRWSDLKEEGEQLKWPQSWDREFLEEHGKKLEAAAKAALNEPNSFWQGRMVAVLPSHRGRGIAQQLVVRGIELADKAGESMYLESTPIAKRLYERNGFKSVAEADLPGGYKTDVMLRKNK